MFMAFFFVLPKLLLTAFLATLNAGQDLRGPALQEDIVLDGIASKPNPASGPSALAVAYTQKGQNLSGGSRREGEDGSLVELEAKYDLDDEEQRYLE